MKNRVFFQPLYFLCWLLFFVVARGIFLLYHSSRAQGLSAADILQTFRKGVLLDASFTAYIAVIPFLFMVLAAAMPHLKIRGFLRYYTFTVLVLLSLLVVIDLELYRYWGFRLDATPLQYLNTPGEMLASAGSAPVLLLMLVLLVLCFSFAFLFSYAIAPATYRQPFSRLLSAVVALLYLVLLILPMRGGLQLSPINQSSVYFSQNPFANHAGLNVPWNLMHALLKYNKQASNPYQYMPLEEANAEVELLQTSYQNSGPAPRYLQTDKPNVIFIILESFTAKLVGSLGGEAAITPNLDRLAAEGINFTNMYASGDRSEKGIVALLSGYPVQTNTSIIKSPQKTEKLPQLSQVFEELGYETSFYYGGELEFANIKSYLLNGGYNRLIDKHDFPSESYNSKWGAHDHVVLERVLQDLNNEQQPFFTTVFTLSSHEPYEVPIPAKFSGEDNTSKFRNSVYYTDWALGNFMAEAKKQPWWQNTLVVLVADHGHPLPADDANHVPSKFKIPFIMTGGALTRTGLTVATLGDHTDVAPTLLGQFGIDSQPFRWGNNLLAPNANSSAFYVFNDGFGYITPEGTVTFDNLGKQVITRDATVTDAQVKQAKALMQVSFEDFINR